jgi:transposase
MQEFAEYETVLRPTRAREGEALDAQLSSLLDIPEVQVLEIELTPGGDYTLTVESTRAGTQGRACGREIREVHGADEGITLSPLPILGREVFIRLRPQR